VSTAQIATLDHGDARSVRVRQRAGLAGLAVVALLGLEVSLRLASVDPSARGLDAVNVFAEYPLTRHDGYVTLQKGWSGLLWGLPFQVNEHGFRSPAVPLERRPDSLRILLLGSCITLGGLDQTPDGFSAFSSSLESALQERFRDRRVEVLNAGVPGSFELQSLVYWQAELARFEPDIVVYESGTSQIIEPGARLEEYAARPPGATKPARGAWPHGLRERLYELFDRSVVVSHFYAFRRDQEGLFRKYFFRRRAGTTSDSRAADAYVADVLVPGGELYRRDLSRLFEAFRRDGAAVVAYTFSHALPDVPADALSERDLEALSRIDLMLQMPRALDVADLWRIFHRAYAQVTEINREVAAEQGVAYFDLQRQLRSPRYHDGYYYYLQNTAGSERKGELLARYILARYDTYRRSFRLGAT
jgi:hypothetical protein